MIFDTTGAQVQKPPSQANLRNSPSYKKHLHAELPNLCEECKEVSQNSSALCILPRRRCFRTVFNYPPPMLEGKVERWRAVETCPTPTHSATVVRATAMEGTEDSSRQTPALRS